MALPPNDLSPDELWAKLEEYPRPSEIVDFPRKGPDGKALTRLRIMVLTHDDHNVARRRAFEKIQKMGFKREDVNGDVMLREIYNDQAAKEVLALACYTVKKISGSDDDKPQYARFFGDARDMGNKLSADEIVTLFNAYNIVQNKYGPYEGNIESPEELSAWIKRLVEGGSAHPLAYRSLLQLTELSSLLAERSYILSVILESQWTSLPESFKSNLERLGIGTSYFGSRQLISAETGFELSDPIDDSETGAMDLPLTPTEGTLTIEQAARIAQELHKG